MEIDVNQPTPAISLTSRGTLGEAYLLSLHVTDCARCQDTLQTSGKGTLHKAYSFNL